MDDVIYILHMSFGHVYCILKGFIRRVPLYEKRVYSMSSTGRQMGLHFDLFLTPRNVPSGKPQQNGETYTLLYIYMIELTIKIEIFIIIFWWRGGVQCAAFRFG